MIKDLEVSDIKKHDLLNAKTELYNEIVRIQTKYNLRISELSYIISHSLSANLSVLVEVDNSSEK